MADHRRPRARSQESDSGIDVWLPALVAIVAAIFMLMSAHAEEGGDPGIPVAPPQILFDAGRFDPGAIERDAAAAAIARGDYAADQAEAAPQRAMIRHVVVAVLPDIPSAPVTANSAFDRMNWLNPSADLNAAAPSAHDVFERLFALAAISGLLIACLLVLARTWRRTQHPTAV